MTRNLSNIDRHDLPFQSEQADAANSALYAAKRQAVIARESWADVKRVASMEPIDDVPALDAVARRLAVRLEQAVRTMYGLVSTSAAGLWGVDEYGRIARIEDTSGGSDYFDGVRYRKEDGGYRDDVPVSGFIAFFDSAEAAQEWLAPAPTRFPFGRS